MMLLNRTPEAGSCGLTDYYRRCSEEGVVFRSMLRDQSFGMSDAFDPEWSVAAICWCAGGTEKYEFLRRRSIFLKAGAVLAIGEQDRYAFSALGDRPYSSSMIVFPTSITRSLRSDALNDSDDGDMEAPCIETRLFRPDKSMMSRMESIAAACASGESDEFWFEEQASLIAAALFADQCQDQERPDRLAAAKSVTRKELVRRLARAVELIHETYHDPALDLGALAKVACIARHHFVRVFAAAYGVTPLRYLGDVRMEAAARLFESIDGSVADVARQVGYTSRSAFQRRFRSHFGVTPADWRSVTMTRIYTSSKNSTRPVSSEYSAPTTFKP